VDAEDAILREVGSWPGVTADAEGTIRYRGRELGRVADGAVELRVHPRLREMLVETGRASAHADPTRAVGGREGAVELFRLAYERARVAERVRAREP
jgi:hypothetical protein